MDLYGIVIGTLRAFPSLRSLMSDELKAYLTSKDVDGPFHIPQELRWEMYKFAFSVLKSRRVGICKESGKMWAKVQRQIGNKNFICNCHL